MLLDEDEWKAREAPVCEADTLVLSDRQAA